MFFLLLLLVLTLVVVASEHMLTAEEIADIVRRVLVEPLKDRFAVTTRSRVG